MKSSESNSNREIAIKLDNVKKRYHLGQIGGGTLQADLQSWWAKIRGKEDPNTIIGQGQRLVGQTFMALNGIDLTIYKGEAVGIIGGNGAGKSTMLKLLSRVTAPTEGTIEIDGRVASMLEVGTGFNGEMTGRENVYMNGAILGMSKEEIDSKMEEIIEFSEVRAFIDTPVKRYSSGMYVKLAFSVAAHLDSEIMIMDEVLAVGDMAFQKKCLKKMRDAAQKEGRTVLYVSHNMNTIRQLCDRCIVLDKGKVVFEGDCESGIAIYMNSTFNPSLFRSFTKEYHTHLGDKSIYINSLRVLEREDLRIEENDIIKFELCLDVKKETNGVEVRLEIQYEDGTPAGAAMSSESYDFRRLGSNIVRLGADISYLAPGRYKADIIINSVDALGNDYYIDGVVPGIEFEIINADMEEVRIWLHRYWGHTKLKKLIRLE